ncbi:MAG: hypothetical protein JEZ04_05845 [Spirochaetales bacterium]|nr:hypothetical protein [Spirochaetales bacterium]
MLLRIKVKNKDASFGLFFPLILLYLLLLVAIILCGIAYAFMMLAPQKSKQARTWMMFVFKSPRLISAARGMEIMVHSNDSDVKMFVK